MKMWNINDNRCVFLQTKQKHLSWALRVTARFELILIVGHSLFSELVFSTEFFVTEDVVKQYSVHNASKYWFWYIKAFLHFSLGKSSDQWKDCLHHEIAVCHDHLHQKSGLFALMYKEDGGVESWERITWTRTHL